MKLDQFEQHRDNLFQEFERLTETTANKKPVGALQIAWAILNWRMDRMQKRIETQEKRIKKQKEEIIAPLHISLDDLEEETRLRKALNPSLV